MPFQPKPTKKKVQAVYKTLYISEALADQVEALTKGNDTSFKNRIEYSAVFKSISAKTEDFKF